MTYQLNVAAICRPYPYVTAVLVALRADVERVASDVPTEFEFRSIACARRGRLCNVCALFGDCDGRAAVGDHWYVQSMFVRFPAKSINDYRNRLVERQATPQ